MDSTRVTKLAAVVGAVGAVALIGFGLIFPTQEDPASFAGWRRGGEDFYPGREVAEMSPDEHASALIPTLQAEAASERRLGREALSALLKDTVTLGEAAREATAAALIDMHRLSSGTSQEDVVERREALRLLVAAIKGDAARSYAESVLAAGTDADKKVLAEALLEPGALRGGTLYEMAYELTKTPSIPEALKPGLIRKIRGKAAAEELMAFIKETSDKKALSAAAVEVQNLHRPELMGEVIARLDEMELLKDPKTMPWFKGALLSEHIRKAQGVELVRALRVVWTRPSLTKTTFKAVQETLASADPAVRRMAARLVPDAVKYAALQSEEGEATLTARLEVETDPAVKGELEAVIEDIRRTRRPAGDAPEAAPVPEPAAQAQ